MTEKKRARRGPEIIITSSFSETPGSQEELNRILLRWELALARKAQEQLLAEMNPQ